MRRLCLLTLVSMSLAGWAQSDGGALDEARGLMKEGLERDVPAPSPASRREWPGAEGKSAPEPRPAPGAKSAEVLSERVRNEASVRARAAAENRRAAQDEPPGVAQSRTRAAKAVGPPPKTRPPKP